MAIGWWCTYCGDPHKPDAFTKIDERYATGNCNGTHRPLIRDEVEASRLAHATGKLRPKATPPSTTPRPPAPQAQR